MVVAIKTHDRPVQNLGVRAAIVQVLEGRLRFTADGEELDAGPGFWLHMTAGTPHALEAVEPTLMLLTLLRP